MTNVFVKYESVSERNRAYYLKGLLKVFLEAFIIVSASAAFVLWMLLL